VPHDGHRSLHFLIFYELLKRNKLGWTIMFS